MIPAHSYPEWEPAYTSALLETDREVMPQRLADAEAAMLARKLRLSPAPEHETERHAIHEALRNIDILKSERVD